MILLTRLAILLANNRLSYYYVLFICACVNLNKIKNSRKKTNKGKSSPKIKEIKMLAPIELQIDSNQFSSSNFLSLNYFYSN